MQQHKGILTNATAVLLSISVGVNKVKYDTLTIIYSTIIKQRLITIAKGRFLQINAY